MTRARRAVVVLLSVSLGVLTVLSLFPSLGDKQVYYVASGNMERTLPVDSYAVVSRGDVKRGDIVVYRGTLGGEFDIRGIEPKQFLQRAVAAGGDTIECCDAEGRLLLNGEAIKEPYVFEDNRLEFGPVQVPAGRLFMLGDHRSQSSDSRYYSQDPVQRTAAEADVVGTVSGGYSRLSANALVLGYRLLVGLAVALPSLLLLELRERRQQKPTVGTV